MGEGENIDSIFNSLIDEDADDEQVGQIDEPMEYYEKDFDDLLQQEQLIY